MNEVRVMIDYGANNPVGVVMPLGEFFEGTKSIDWNIMRDATGMALIAYPNTAEDKAKLILAEREYVAKKLVHAIMKAFQKLDTDNGYPMEDRS